MPTISYRLQDGTRVKGCTTIKGQNVGWGKDPLMYWANKMGREGKTMNEARNTATRPGTLAHLLIEYYLKGDTDAIREVLGRRYNEVSDLF
jgi:hypothetical protein